MCLEQNRAVALHHLMQQQKHVLTNNKPGHQPRPYPACFIFTLIILLLCLGNSCNKKQAFYKDNPCKSFPKPKNYVNDFEKILSAKQEKSLNTILRKHDSATTNQIAVVTIDSIAPYDSLYNYSLDMANCWELGTEDKDNGVLIALSKKLQQVRIQNGYGIEEKISDEETKKIIDEKMIPVFQEGKFYQGLKKGIEALISKIK